MKAATSHREEEKLPATPFAGNKIGVTPLLRNMRRLQIKSDSHVKSGDAVPL